MMNRRPHSTPSFCLLCGLLFLFDAPALFASGPTSASLSAFTAYAHTVETRLANQHQAPENFLALSTTDTTHLRQGQLLLERLTPTSLPGLDGALLHHWRGTIFVPGAHAEDFERLMRDFNAYPQHFAPQVVEAHAVTQTPNHLLASMRVRQHHVLTVLLDSTYDVTFGHLDTRHGYSLSRSTRIDELDAASHPLPADSQHGFLWRQNTYWSFEERDGGLYLQIESLSLTRSIPTGLGWAIRPYIESIPRESLEFTLRSAANALHHQP